LIMQGSSLLKGPQGACKDPQTTRRRAFGPSGAPLRDHHPPVPYIITGL
jgi:hypothetical protein